MPKTDTPATRIKAKLQEKYPGMKFQVRATQGMAAIEYVDSIVNPKTVRNIAQTECEGRILITHCPRM